MSETVFKPVDQHRQNYFEAERYLSFEAGYPERNMGWFRKYILPDVLKQFPEPKRIKLTLLDAGCASGYFTRELAQFFGFTRGLDFTQSRIEYARQYQTRRLVFDQVDLVQPLDDAVRGAKFDVFFTNAVIPHIPLANKVRVFDNLARIAAPNAKMLAYDGKTGGVIDAFVGLYSPEWLQTNVKSWKLESCEHVVDETFRYVLTLA